MLFSISLPTLAEYHRSQKAKAAFKLMHPCPATGKVKGSCHGYIFNHAKALACAGVDSPSNSQW